MKATIIARKKWDYYQERTRITSEGLPAYPDSGLRNVPAYVYFKNGEPDQMPDVYYQYKQCERWGTFWEDGALADQPHILMMEFDVCKAAEVGFDSDPEVKLMKDIDIAPLKARMEQR